MASYVYRRPSLPRPGRKRANRRFVHLHLSLVAGVLSFVTKTNTTVGLSATSATGGTAPITLQLERSPSGAGTWANVSGQTSSPFSDSGLVANTAYDYRVAYTDAAATTVYSNTVTVTTDFSGGSGGGNIFGSPIFGAG